MPDSALPGLIWLFNSALCMWAVAGTSPLMCRFLKFSSPTVFAGDILIGLAAFKKDWREQKEAVSEIHGFRPVSSVPTTDGRSHP